MNNQISGSCVWLLFESMRKWSSDRLLSVRLGTCLSQKIVPSVSVVRNSLAVWEKKEGQHWRRWRPTYFISNLPSPCTKVRSGWNPIEKKDTERRTTTPESLKRKSGNRKRNFPLPFDLPPPQSKEGSLLWLLSVNKPVNIDCQRFQSATSQ